MSTTRIFPTNFHSLSPGVPARSFGQDFLALEKALREGRLADARKAMAALEKHLDDQSGSKVNRDAVMPIRGVEKDFQVLKNAVNTGDPATALTAIKHVVQGALKAETELANANRSRPEEKTPESSRSTSDSTAPEATPAESTSSPGDSTVGTVLNVKV